MGQIKIYGRAEFLERNREAVSEGIHQALVTAFAYPPEKRFQRFFPLADGDFLVPADRDLGYLIIEVFLFPGRTTAAKKAFYRNVLANLNASLGIPPRDLEIVLVEIPRENWSIRGIPGDELNLNYKIEV